jgi:hypothetical protein
MGSRRVGGAACPGPPPPPPPLPHALAFVFLTRAAPGVRLSTVYLHAPSLGCANVVTAMGRAEFFKRVDRAAMDPYIGKLQQRQRQAERGKKRRTRRVPLPEGGVADAQPGRCAHYFRPQTCMRMRGCTYTCMGCSVRAGS